MSWESFGVVGFDLGPLLQGQMRIPKLKMLITRLLLVLEVWEKQDGRRGHFSENCLHFLLAVSHRWKVESLHR